MAKPLEERQRAALSKSARLADVLTTISDTQAALELASVEFEAQKAKSLDPSVASEEARAARYAAADAEHDRERHRAALVALSAKRESLIESEATAERIKSYDAALTARDELAAALRREGAEALKTLVALIQRIVDQDRQLAVVNGSLPKGRPHLDSAEHVARGIMRHGMWADGVHYALRLTDLTIPHFDRPAMAWPDEEGQRLAQAAAYERDVQKQREARMRREEREASRRWYTVKRTDQKIGTMRFQHANGIFGLGLQTWPCELYDDQVEAAKAAGMIVTPAEAPEMAKEGVR